MLTTPDEQPRLLKIEVETVDFDKDTQENKNNQNTNSKKFKKELKKKDESVQRRQTSEIQDKDQNLNYADCEIEKKIKKKIDLIKEIVKRELEERKKIKEIELNNEKFDKIQGINKKDTANNFDNDIKEKKSVSIEKDNYENNTRKKRRVKNKKTKKSISTPERAQVKIGDKLSPDSEIDRRLGFNEVKKYSRSSRDVGESRGLNSEEKSYQQIRSGNNEPQNFLFPGQSEGQRKRRMPFHHKKFTNKSPKNARWRRAKHNHRQQNQRIERAADEGFNEVRSDSVAESNGLVDVSNSQDISPQLSPEYQEAFGGLPSDTGSALMRYKRIKRDKY